MLCLYGRSEPTRKIITFPTTYIPNGEVGNHFVDGRVVDFEYISPCANPILVVGLETGARSWKERADSKSPHRRRKVYTSRRVEM